VKSQRTAAFVGLGVLSLINLVNYLDRYILAGVMRKVQAEFTLTDAEGGSLATTFMLVYMFASPVGGYLGDRLPRRFLIGAAVAVWSVATIGSGLATTFVMLLVARALTGVGEAGYGTVAPSFISDLFDPRERSRWLSVFYTAMPLGAALGFILGGLMADRATWHHAFYAGGVPGLVLAVAVLFLKEPRRGAMDGPDTPRPVAFFDGLGQVGLNPRFWFTTAGLTLMTFSVGGLSFWMPKYLAEHRGLSDTDAGLYLGATTVIGGLVGTLAGGFLGDWLDARRPGGGVLLSALGLLAAAPLMVASAVVEQPNVLFVCLLLAQFFIFLQGGPLNASILAAVPPTLRAFAFGLSTLTLHFLGDAISPTVIGVISDAAGLGLAIKLNALPLALGGVVLLLGLRHFRAAVPPPRAA